MDKFLTYVGERRSKLQRQMLKLEHELAELDKAERLYQASGAASAYYSDNQPTETTQALFALGLAEPSQEQEMEGTIKQRVLRILKDNPRGLTSGQILQKLKGTGLPHLARESLSPQLSRLKASFDITLNPATGLWLSLPKRETQAG